MSVKVKWTDGAMRAHETAIEDWRICESLTYHDVYSGMEIVRMCLDSMTELGIASIDEMWYED